MSEVKRWKFAGWIGSFVASEDFDRLTKSLAEVTKAWHKTTDKFYEDCQQYKAALDAVLLRAETAEAELAALREALQHIEKTCGQSRTVTRRLRWIGKRCELVLAGRPYVASEHELPLSAESEHFKLLRQNGRIKESLAAAEQRNADLVELLVGLSNAGDWYTSALEFDRNESGYEWLAKVEVAIKPAESGESE